MANVEKKIWIITELYYPTLNSTGYYMTEIAEYLAKNNQDVNVLCSNLTYNTNLVTTIKSEVRNKVRINRVLLKQIDKNNFSLRNTIPIYGMNKTNDERCYTAAV